MKDGEWMKNDNWWWMMDDGWWADRDRDSGSMRGKQRWNAIFQKKKREKKMFFSDCPYRELQIGALLHQVLGVLELAIIGGLGQSGLLVFTLEGCSWRGGKVSVTSWLLSMLRCKEIDDGRRMTFEEKMEEERGWGIQDEKVRHRG